MNRRFKDFADLNSLVKQNFKGHHLRSSLPTFPEKTLKVLTDHRDPDFIQERRRKLESYLVLLVAVPHVADMTCLKSFLGLMEKVLLAYAGQHKCINFCLMLAGSRNEYNFPRAGARAVSNPSNEGRASLARDCGNCI